MVTTRAKVAWQRTRERLIVADPGFLRLRSATRGTFIVGACFLVLYRFGEYLHQPITLAFIGALIGMMGNLAVNDATIDNQKRTVAAVTATALVAVLIGAVLAPWHQLSLAIFIGLVFLAVFLRRYGPRGSAIGLTAFMAYFCTFIFPLPLSTLPVVAGTLLLTGAVTYVIRFGVIGDRPARIHFWNLVAFRYALGLLLAELSRSLRRGDPAATGNRSFERRLARLQDLAFHLDDAMAGGDQLRLWSGARLRAFRGALFELEIAARRMTEITLERLRVEAATSDDREDWIARLETEASRLRDETRNFGALPASPVMPELFGDFERAARVLFDHTPEGRSPEDAAAAPMPSAPAVDIDLNLRQAVQATLATGIATVAGTMVSPQRWYWASVTSFVLFTGATRGDTLRRAFHRLWGTLLGLVIGVGVAWVFNGHRDVELALVFLCIFGGIHSTKAASYAWPTMWFSLMVALFFSLLGQMTREIFLLRLEQTLIGAVAGGLCAALVLPVSTSGRVREAFRALLERLAETLDELARDEKTAPRRERREMVRALERQLTGLKALAGPLRGGFALTRSSDVETFLHAATALVHYARQLTVFFAEQSKGEEPGAVTAALRSVASQARAVAAGVEVGGAAAPAPVELARPGALFATLRHLSGVLAALSKSRETTSGSTGS